MFYSWVLKQIFTWIGWFKDFVADACLECRCVVEGTNCKRRRRKHAFLKSRGRIWWRSYYCCDQAAVVFLPPASSSQPGRCCLLSLMLWMHIRWIWQYFSEAGSPPLSIAAAVCTCSDWKLPERRRRRLCGHSTGSKLNIVWVSQCGQCWQWQKLGGQSSRKSWKTCNAIKAINILTTNFEVKC